VGAWAGTGEERGSENDPIAKDEGLARSRKRDKSVLAEMIGWELCTTSKNKRRRNIKRKSSVRIAPWGS
jgi:hypothetical protein